MARSDADLYAALDLDARSRRRGELHVQRRRGFDLRPLFALAAVVALVVAAGEFMAPRQSPASSSMRQVPLYVSSSGTPWLTMPLPDGWSVAQRPEAPIGRAGSRREVLIGNLLVDEYVTGQPYPAHLDWSRLPRTAVVVEMRDLCGGIACVGAGSETTFPLHLAAAEPLTAGLGGAAPSIPASFDARQLLLRYFGESHVLITYVGDRASASDRALVETIVSGIAPAPLPSSGVIHDQWLALGPASALTPDVPVFGTLPAQATLAPAAYVVIRHGTGLIAHPMLYRPSPAQSCPLTWDPTTGTLSCSGRTERWDRYGRATVPGASDLDQFVTLVRDGNAYLFFNSVSSGPVQLP
jgi:hypothetical protein